MIRVTIELLPLGKEDKSQVLGQAIIHNTGMGSWTKGKYKYKLLNKANRRYKDGNVENFPRTRLNAWHLLKRVLDDAFGKV